jgi:hypothetical protein
MKKSLAIAILGSAAFWLLAGCASGPAIVKALAKDQAIVTGNIMTPYGSSRFTRIGATTNTVVISPDGTVTVNK